jgi:hypothetical protein
LAQSIHLPATVQRSCYGELLGIAEEFRTYPDVTQEGLSALREHAVFRGLKRLPKILNPGDPKTWTYILFNGRAKQGVNNLATIAQRISLIVTEFKLIDIPEFSTSDEDWPTWFAEVKVRLRRRSGRYDLRFLEDEDLIFSKIEEVVERGNKRAKLTIYNTVFTRSAPDFTFSDEFITRFENLKHGILTGNCDWRDIVLATDETKYFETARTPPLIKSTLKHVIFNIDLPLFQVLAFKRGNRVAAAFVGWMFLGARQVRTYYSDDRETAEYFYDYVVKLYDKADEWNKQGGASNERGSPKKKLVKSRKSKRRA